MEKLNISTGIKSHFLRLYQMAFADDNFDVLELKMLYRFAEERGLTKDHLNEILLNPSHESEVPDTLEEKIEYLYDLAIMIWADGIVTEDETNTLKKYCLKFEFLEENIEDICEFLLENAREKISLKELTAKMQD